MGATRQNRRPELEAKSSDRWACKVLARGRDALLRSVNLRSVEQGNLAKPLKVPVGVTDLDFGLLAFVSYLPTPRNAGGMSTSCLDPELASKSVQRDPWVGCESVPQARPPSQKMHERFQERLELFLSEVKAHPEQFRGKVLRRRHNLLSVTEMADKKRPVASSIDSAVVAAVPRASSLPLERTRDCDVASAASAAVATAVVKAAVAAVVVGKDESQEVSSPPLRERSKSANAAGRSHSSKYVGNSNSVVVASAAPAPSPSAVPSDSAGPGLQMSIAPRGLPSRPSPSRGEAFSPPRRLGWVKMPSSTWLLHPEARDWLYEPDEGVYFHAPSETLWREEQHSLAVAAAAAAALAAEEACSHLRLEPADHKSSRCRAQGRSAGDASLASLPSTAASAASTPLAPSVHLS
mmetsp:Transcript_98082/g.245770  ORF Transcript_98082/g.245770 Transcript_98082/m.245770 type:complete len:408 (-) Transcript_98082:235-1458(-)